MSRLLTLVLACLAAACLQLPPAAPGPPAVGWNEALAALAERLPVGRAVEIRVCHIPEELEVIGMTMPGPLGSLRILVDADLCEQDRLRVLAHEWAHAMTWGRTVGDDHDEAWGVAFSRAYRVVVYGWEPPE